MVLRPPSSTRTDSLFTYTTLFRSLIDKRIGELAQRISEGFGCTAEFVFDRKYPPTYNHPHETAFSVQILEDLVGAGNVDAHVQPSMARSEEHTSELQSLMRISYAVFCLKKKTTSIQILQ